MSLSRSLEASRTSLLSASSRVVTFDALGALAQQAQRRATSRRTASFPSSCSSSRSLCCLRLPRRSASQCSFFARKRA